MMVRWYNKVRNTILGVEFPLIESQLQEIDAELEQAETTLHWKDDSKKIFFDCYEVVLSCVKRNLKNVYITHPI